MFRVGGFSCAKTLGGSLSLGQTLCLLVFVFVFNRCLCLPVFFCLPVVCVYGPLNAVLFSQASFPDPDGQFPDPVVDFQTKMIIFFKTASSQKRSRRNSGQNRPIERSTALTGTIFVTISAIVIRTHFQATFSKLLDNFRTLPDNFRATFGPNGQRIRGKTKQI